MAVMKLAEKLGITKLPEGFEHYFEILEENRSRLCTDDMIRRVQEQYNLFGDHYGEVLLAWEDLKKSEEKKLWADLCALYVLENDLRTVRQAPIPAPDGTPGGDLLPLFALIPAAEVSYTLYRDRGFSHAQCMKNLENYRINLAIVRDIILKRPGLTSGYYSWLCLYAKAMIFDHGGLNFEIRKNLSGNFILRNKNTGELMPLVHNKPMHRSGNCLGSAGFEDDTDAFVTAYEETETAFIGNPVVNNLTSREKRVFPKTEWELALAPGDDCLGVHIPRETDFSAEAVSKAYREALEIAKKSYPEFSFKAFTCTSWLLDPALNEILGEQAKISNFSARYSRFPAKNGGKDVFSYVYRMQYGDIPLEELPENTRLQRALKQKYLNGESILAFSGVIMMD